MLRRQVLVLAILIMAGLICAYAADITGKWNAEFDSQVGKQVYVFEFKVEGAKLTGNAISKIGDATTPTTTPITEGTIKGDAISFVENLDYNGSPLKISYKGTISGDEIKLSRMVGDMEGETFVAKKAK